MSETVCCTLCDNHCPLSELACLKGRRFYERDVQPYCRECENHCLLTALSCERGRAFYGGAAPEQADDVPRTGSLVMRFEMCWHQFRRVRGGLDGQIRVLRFLHNHGAATQREIQEALGVKSAAISEHISKLEAQGYITRTSSERDRRARVIRFTPEGERRFLALLAEEEKKDLFSSLSGEEQSELKRLLKKLSADWRNRESDLRATGYEE